MSENGIQIIGWDEVFESAHSRKLKRMKWVPNPVGIQSRGLLILTTQFGEEGVAAFGVFQLIVQFHATNQDIDGRRTGIISQESPKVLPKTLLGALLRIPNKLLMRSLEILCSEEVAWLREISPKDLPTFSHTSPNLGIGIGIDIDVPVEGESEGESSGQETEPGAMGIKFDRIAARIAKFNPAWKPHPSAESRRKALEDEAAFLAIDEDKDLATLERFHRLGDKPCQSLSAYMGNLPAQIDRAHTWAAAKGRGSFDPTTSGKSNRHLQPFEAESLTDDERKANAAELTAGLAALRGESPNDKDQRPD